MLFLSTLQFSPPAGIRGERSPSKCLLRRREMYDIGPFHVESVIDLITVFIVVGLVALSLLSLSFIFHLNVMSRASPPLRDFNKLWSVRLLLVSFAFLRAINEVARLPCFRRSLSAAHQADLCKLHVVLSLGFFEPAFLLTTLFLLSASVNKVTNPCPVLLLSLPVFLLNLLLLYSPDRTSIQAHDDSGQRTVYCAYPLSTTLLFALFAAAYSACFLISCFNLLSIVINRNLRLRIWALGLTVALVLPAQVLLLAVSTWWSPNAHVYAALTLGVFVGAVLCAAVGEGILVIRPINDALLVGGGYTYRWGPPPEESSTQPLVVKVR